MRHADSSSFRSSVISECHWRETFVPRQFFFAFMPSNSLIFIKRRYASMKKILLDYLKEKTNAPIPCNATLTALSVQRNFQFNGMFTPTELFHDGRFSVLRFQVLLVIN